MEEAPQCKRVHYGHGPSDLRPRTPSLSFRGSDSDSDYRHLEEIEERRRLDDEEEIQRLEMRRLEDEEEIQRLENVARETAERAAVIEQMDSIMPTWAICEPRGLRWADCFSDEEWGEALSAPLPAPSAAVAAGEPPRVVAAVAAQGFIVVGSSVRVGDRLSRLKSKFRGLVGRVVEHIPRRVGSRIASRWAVLFPNGDRVVLNESSLQVVDDEELVAHAMVGSISDGDSHAPQLRATSVAPSAEEVFTCVAQIAMMDKADEDRAVVVRRLEAGDTLRPVQGHDEVITPGGDTWRLMLCYADPRQEGYVRLSDKQGKEYVCPLRPRSSRMERTHNPHAAVARYYNSTTNTHSLYILAMQAAVAADQVATAVAEDLEACFFVMREAPSLFRIWAGGSPIRITDYSTDSAGIQVEAVEQMPAWAGFCHVQLHWSGEVKLLPSCPLRLKKWWRWCQKRIVKELLRLFVMLARARSDYASNYAFLQRWLRAKKGEYVVVTRGRSNAGTFDRLG